MSREFNRMANLLTIDEVAQRLAIPASTLRYWRARSEGPPAVKVGRLVRYDPLDVENWLAEQKGALDQLSSS